MLRGSETRVQLRLPSNRKSKPCSAATKSKNCSDRLQKIRIPPALLLSRQAAIEITKPASNLAQLGP